MLRIQNLKKSFGQLVVLNEVSLEVRKGELKAVIGPNGAGKTTLFNIISGRLLPDSGHIFFQGKNVTRMKPHALSRMGLARSFQINNFFSRLSVLDNILLAVQSRYKRAESFLRNSADVNRINESAAEVLESIGLAGQAHIKASNLSYGDQRKLEIGLALGTNPSLLLLDEPTSGMSRLESNAMMDLIRQLSKQVTIVLIEHDIEFVMKLADSVFVMHYGEKIAEGKPSEIEKNEEVQRVYLGGL